MSSLKKHPHWSREEFLAFILLHAANADMECTDEERGIILEKISEDHLATVEAEYADLNDYQRLNIIQTYRPLYFKDKAQKAQILVEVEKIFNADGAYDVMEHSTYLMLQKIL
jgi:thiosulfate/3-mercaptopyruvate sulfurtransferase